LINQQLRVTGDVDEEDVGDLELDLFFNFGGHLFARTLRKSLSDIKLEVVISYLLLVNRTELRSKI